MVVFACSSCGQSVKKNQVESHYSFQCRNCESLSCMDCGKVFWGDEYKSHTKCISEDQKYGGKDYQAKPNSNKGEIKQEKWIEHIKNVISTKDITGPLKNYLEQIVTFSNIPRKKSKFENFLKNSMKLRNPVLISKAWEIFAESTANEKNQLPQSPAVNGGVKRPLDDKEENPSKKICSNGTPVKGIQKELLDKLGNIPAEVTNSEDFKWVETMERILKECPDNTLNIRLLRKLVTAIYYSSVKNSTLSKSEIKKKFKEIVKNSDLFTLTNIN